MAFIGVTGGTSVFGDDVTFETPEGVSEGDRLLFAFSIVDQFQPAKDGGFTPPSGEYARIYADPDDTTGTLVFTKVAGPSESTHVFGLANSFIQHWFCAAYDACDITDIAGQRSVSPEWIAPSVDVDHPDSTLVTITKAIAPQVADGQTQRIAQDATFSENILQLADEEPSIGPTGTRSADCTHYGWSAINIVLAPVETGGSEGVDADVAAELPAFEASAAVALEMSASVAATLPAFTASAAGELSTTAVATAEISPFTASVSASIALTAVASASLPAFEASAGAELAVAAVVSAELSAFEASASAEAIIEAAATAELSAFEAGAEVSLVVVGSAAASLPAFTATAEAVAEVIAAVAAELPAFTASAVATVGDAVFASVAASLPAFEASAEAVNESAPLSAAVAASLPAFEASASAELAVSASVSADLPAFTASATVESEGAPLVAEIAATMPAFEAAAESTLSMVATVAASMPAFTASAEVEIENRIEAQGVVAVSIVGLGDVLVAAMAEGVVSFSVIAEGEVTVEEEPGAPPRPIASGLLLTVRYGPA